MTLLIDISPAVEEDFLTLAHIAAVAMSVDLVHRVIYEGNNPFDTSRQEQSVLAQLRNAASNSQAHVYKATLKSSQKIIGYAMLRFQDGSQVARLHTKPLATASSSDTKAAFMEMMRSRVEAAHDKYIAGIRHIWWTHLMVLPQFQRQGIGSSLFQYGIEHLGVNEVPIWLVTQIRGRALYLKLGFQDIDVIDVDLSDYAGPWKGFGIQRNICMLRQPGGIASPDVGAHIKW